MTSQILLKGGAPIPKITKCSADHQWKASEIIMFIKKGVCDQNKDYYCIELPWI